MEILVVRILKNGSWCCLMEIIIFSLNFQPQETSYKLHDGRMGEDAIGGRVNRYRTEDSN